MNGKSAFHFSPATLASALLLLAPALMMLNGCGKRSASSGSTSTDQSMQPVAKVSFENGQAVITLDTATQKRLGLTATALEKTVTRAQEAFPAMVLPVQSLTDFRSGYIATKAQWKRASLQAGFASKEYARLQSLAGPDQNVSEKALQSAEATLQSDQADVEAAQQQLDLKAQAVRQDWGGVIAGWATADAPQFRRLLDRSKVLVQLTMPEGTMAAPPRQIVLELPGGGKTGAAFVSATPKVDPRIQGRSYLYLAAGRADLAPGLNLEAHLPVGSELTGVVIPSTAVLWSEGKAWVYVQVAANRFSRSPVSTDLPVENGYFAGKGFSAGDRIVVSGAQALLSEEMLLHSQGGGE